MSNKWVSVALLSTFMLGGCGSLSLQNLRENASGSLSFEVDQSYQNVYATVLKQTRSCYLMQPQKAQLAVRDKKDIARKQGYITVKYLYDATGEEYFLDVDVQAVDDNKTKVQVFFKPFYKENDGAAVKSWIVDGSTSCAI